MSFKNRKHETPNPINQLKNCREKLKKAKVIDDQVLTFQTVAYNSSMNACVAAVELVHLFEHCINSKFKPLNGKIQY